MFKNKRIIIYSIILIMLIAIIGGTFSFYTWNSLESQKTEISFSATGGFSCSARGVSTIDSTGVSLIPTDCTNPENKDHVIMKEITTTVSNSTGSNAYMNMWLEVKKLGNYLSDSENFKYALTTSSESCNTGLVSTGSFSQLAEGERVLLLEENKYASSKEETYYLWIWLDSEETEIPPMDEDSRSFEFSLNGECSDKEVIENFVITDKNTNYQSISVTATNTIRNINAYAVIPETIEGVSYDISNPNLSGLNYKDDINNIMLLSSEPTEDDWIEITDNISKTYTLKYEVSEPGIYYVWFRDTSGNTVSDSVEVSNFDTTKPNCIWSTPSKSILQANEEATITLTCTDNESGIDNSVKLNVNDISLSTNSIEIKGITEEQITNGYKYVVTIKQRRDNGSVTLTIPNNKIKDIAGNGNDEVTSEKIEMSKSYNISYKDLGDLEFSGVHEEGYPVSYSSGVVTILDMPIKNGYSFSGYYLDSAGEGDVITSISETQTGDIILYAKFIDNIAPYGTANLSLNDGAFTLSLSDYGDEGSGIVNTYGYAISTSSTCSGASYIESSELSMKFSDTYETDTKYYGCIKLSDNASNIGYIVSGGITYQPGEEFNEVYSQTSSGEYTYTIPQSGIYKLEVWGAQGGTYSNYLGGYGGYSAGNIFLSKDDTLYINVGGIGGSNNTVTNVGGYNGGGYSGNNSGAKSYGGGGATHIAISSGLLYTFSSKIDEVLIVAGGGGGATSGSTTQAGHGGGHIGNKGTSSNSAYNNSTYLPGGGTQNGPGYAYEGTTRQGTFGRGILSNTRGWGGGGGGGYYGGSNGHGTTGAGGSGYIGNSLLTDKYMYCYNCTTSDEESTRTYTTTNVSEEPISNYAKKGNGAVKISIQPVMNITTINVTYNNNKGSGCYSKSVTIGESYGSLCTPIRSGYTFDGWWSSADGGTQITSDTIVTSETNHTIYAHWIKATKPVIIFEPNGNIEYTKDGISSRITVTKGSSTLNPTTFKYIFSKDSDAEPTNSFISGNSYSLNEGEGIYYLIAEACDITGECTRKVSEPFHIDTIAPSVEITSLVTSGRNLNVEINANDGGSGIKNYGYLIQTSDVCPEIGYIESENTNYSFNVSESGTYYVCVKVYDKAGNTSIIITESISITITVDYESISNNYSCANSSAGSSPLFEYTGNCQIVETDDGWKIKYLTSGDLTLNVSLSVDLFLVGGGGGGSGGGGGGGYTQTYPNQKISSGVYQIEIGAGGAAGKDGEQSYFDSSDVYYANGGKAASSNGGAGGSGGGGTRCDYCLDPNCYGTGSTNYGVGGKFGNSGSSGGSHIEWGWNTCYGGSGGTGQGTTTCEFGEGTLSACQSGVTAYSQGGLGAAVTANSGNGGNGGSAGSSGIVIMRNAKIIEVNGVQIGTYTGGYEIIDEGDNNWKIKFISSGTLNLTSSIEVDLFLVGGGGGGGASCSTTPGSYCQAGGGGGGGYTKTYFAQTIAAGTYDIVVGLGGGVGSAGGISYFNNSDLYYANGGNPGTLSVGGSGGSGGGSASCSVCQGWDASGCVNHSSIAGIGGKFGSSGTGCSSSSGGTGQGSTTCEFGEGTTSSCNSGVTAYSQGGRGSTYKDNSGNGGNTGGAGSSGTVIIRNKR